MNLQTNEVTSQAIIDTEKGIKNKDVAKKYGVPLSTISTLLKNKIAIKEKFLAADVGSTRQMDKKAKFQKIENALIQWLTQARSQNKPLSGEI